MNFNVRLLIFDLDGTLVDTKRDIVLCVNRALAARGLPFLDEEKIAKEIGQGTEHLYQQLLSPSVLHSEIKSLVKHFKNFYSKHLFDHAAVYPGVKETLEFFRTVPKIIITNKSQEFADLLVDKLQLKHHFDAVFGAEAFSTRKPDGGPLEKVCAMWKAEPRHAAIVGDSVFDIMAGKNASVKTVAALYGFTEPDELRKYAPDHEIGRAFELTNILGC